MSKNDSPCPNCGYCPTCGRARVSWGPYWWNSPTTWWWSNTSGTATSGNYTITNGTDH